MRKKLFHNWSLKLASLVLAFVLWFLVVQIDDPKDTQTYRNIPVHLTNTELLDRENKVYEVLEETDSVTVRVRAPRSVFKQLRASDIVAEADVSKLTDINTIVITYDTPNVNGVESIDGNHDVVKLNVENRATKWISVKYNTVGEVAENYMLANVSTDQTNVEVTGAESAVQNVSYAGVEIDVTGANSTLSANPDLVLYDKEGQPIENAKLTTNVDYVHMTVEVLAVKEVPVEVNYMGVPADGYMPTGLVLCDPASVKVAGTAYALSGVTKISIPEDRLNITGESSDMTDIINLREFLPDNVRLADSGTAGSKATVTIGIAPIVKRELQVPVENVGIVGLPAGFEARLPETLESFTVNVSGLGEQITPLTAATVTGRIDIAAWMAENEIEELTAGGYTIPVTFNLPEDIVTEKTEVHVAIAEIE